MTSFDPKNVSYDVVDFHGQTISLSEWNIVMEVEVCTKAMVKFKLATYVTILKLLVSLEVTWLQYFIM
jgi:hypothetical protein